MNLERLMAAASDARATFQQVAFCRPISGISVEPLLIKINVRSNLPAYDDESFTGLVMSPHHAEQLASLVASARMVKLLSDEPVIAVDRRTWQNFLDAFSLQAGT
jgi:hypothetical protein